MQSKMLYLNTMLDWGKKNKINFLTKPFCNLQKYEMLRKLSLGFLIVGKLILE